MEFLFRKEDIEVVRDFFQKKIQTIEKERIYSIPKEKNFSSYQKIKRIIDYLESILQDNVRCNNLLYYLNTGTYSFSPMIINYYLDKIFFRVRLMCNPVVVKMVEDNSLTKQYEEMIVYKLIANKLNEFITDICGIDKRNFFRDYIISDMIKTINNYLVANGNLENIIIVRSDFKSFTQNIKREVLLNQLKIKGIPENYLRLINNYLKTGNIVSSSINKNRVKKILCDRFRSEFSTDSDFRALINENGLLMGNPLTNALGNFYLLEFDNNIRKQINEGDFYRRAYDDFIIISFNKTSKLVNIIKDSLGYITENKDYLENIIDYNILSYKSEFNFLGYRFSFDSQRRKINVSIRYKTLKKFIYKFNYEIRLKREYNLSQFLKLKWYYLFKWLVSFKFINDTKLLDAIYVELIIPDIMYGIKRFNEAEPITNEKIKQIKRYFKPTIIHRLIRRGRLNTKSAQDYVLNKELNLSQH